jgi:hypothetical protein
MSFSLRKISILENNESLLPAGYQSINLPSIKLFDYVTGETKEIESFDEITEGWQVVIYGLSDFHRTSKISKVIERDDRKIVFITQTSTYELTGEFN